MRALPIIWKRTRTWRSRIIRDHAPQAPFLQRRHPKLIHVSFSQVRKMAYTMRVQLIGHFKPCMTGIYLHIDARMADYIRTHPYAARQSLPAHRRNARASAPTALPASQHLTMLPRWPPNAAPPAAAREAVRIRYGLFPYHP